MNFAQALILHLNKETDMVMPDVVKTLKTLSDFLTTFRNELDFALV